jgi:hypothetical protein
VIHHPGGGGRGRHGGGAGGGGEVSHARPPCLRKSSGQVNKYCMCSPHVSMSGEDMFPQMYSILARDKKVAPDLAVPFRSQKPTAATKVY